MHRIAGGTAGLSAAGLVALLADESARPSPLAIPILVVVFLAAAAVWFFTRPSAGPTTTIDSKADRGGKVGTVAGSSAGGDIHVGDRNTTYQPPAVPAPSRAERFRVIRDEIGHLKRRFNQLEKQRQEWSSVRPPSHIPYQRLPAEKWNLYGASLNFPQADHDVVQEAYELLNDFNHEMERRPLTFGEPEPDLDGLREAFDEAEQVIAAASVHRESSNPYGRATQLQREWESKALGAALLSIRQELVVSQRRLKRMLQRGSSKDFRGFPSAQWSRHEQLVRREAPSVCVLADQAYGLVVEMRESGLEDQRRKVRDEETELGREALGLFERTIAAIDEGQP